MVNFIWLFFIVVGFVAAILNGHMERGHGSRVRRRENRRDRQLRSDQRDGVLAGLMRIAEDAGLLRKIAVLLQPVVRFLFPDVPKDHPALGYIMSPT